MKLTVIGSWGAYPAANAATSCYLLEHKDWKILIDLGSGALSRLQQYVTVDQINAVVLSHFHHDHVADVGSFQYACLIDQQLQKHEREVPIYAARDDDSAFLALDHVATDARAYKPDEGLQIGPFSFDFIQTKHPKPCYAMRISVEGTTIVYTADTSYFAELTGFAEGADLLLAESSFYYGMDGSVPGHMTSEECGKLAADAEVQQLWLTHLPHFGDHKDLVQEAKQHFHGSVKLAEEGLTFQID
ncbi:MBL fold metallo-hydrolase [Halalkalibacillus halophilus]|uniref:MBL fold metallo-hydrolase n=1 Tax=Halalkalibacillus halophilus TaxID=392827 RepID=UPI0004197CE0|nr:MBL fold metallo-hydrolase [Halalkalibacillus halophilus]